MRHIFCFVVLVLIASSAQAEPLGLIYQNNKAARAFRAEKKMEAYEQFLSALAIDPYDPTVQLNVGSSLQALGEEEKSELLYKQLLKDVELKLQSGLSQEEMQKWLKVKFAALYNLGVYYQIKQEIDPALESYQKALELIPESKEIKTNIELMFNSGGGGKGKGKKDKDKGEGGGEGDQQQQDGEGDQQKDQQGQPQQQKKDQKKGQGKEFDQSQLSMEDLKRIMEELKQQEQGIRAKVQRKGEKSEPKEKQW